MPCARRSPHHDQVPCALAYRRRSAKRLPASTVGAPPGAAEYWNWGTNDPAALTTSRPVTRRMICSVAELEDALTVTAPALEKRTEWTGSRPMASAVLHSARPRRRVIVAVPPKSEAVV